MSSPNDELSDFARQHTDRFAPGTEEGERLRQLTSSGALVTIDQLFGVDSDVALGCIPHPIVANCTGSEALHRHDFYELVYVFRGTCIQRLPDRTIKMEEQSFCLLNTETLHGISIDSEDDVVFSIIVTRELFAHLLAEMSPSDSVLMDFFLRSAFVSNQGTYVLFRPQEGSQARYFARGLLLEQYRGLQSAAQAMKSLFVLLLIELLRTSIYSVEEERDDALRLAPILSYIRDNLAEVSLENLSAHLGYSKSHLSRIVKELTGEPFTAIVSQMRLARATELLSLTSQTVESIALGLGYYDKSHFNRAFKKRFGVSPNEFRRRVAAPSSELNLGLPRYS